MNSFTGVLQGLILCLHYIGEVFIKVWKSIRYGVNGLSSRRCENLSDIVWTVIKHLMNIRMLKIHFKRLLKKSSVKDTNNFNDVFKIIKKKR